MDMDSVSVHVHTQQCFIQTNDFLRWQGKGGDMMLLGWESNEKSTKLEGELELRGGKSHPL